MGIDLLCIGVGILKSAALIEFLSLLSNCNSLKFCMIVYIKIYKEPPKLELEKR
jgi:hypothetical protein